MASEEAGDIALERAKEMQQRMDYLTERTEDFFKDTTSCMARLTMSLTEKLSSTNDKIEYLTRLIEEQIIEKHQSHSV